MDKAGLFKITGDKAVAKAILALPVKMQKRVMRKAVAKGLTPVAKQARKNQQHRSLRKLIGKKVIRKKSGDPAGKVYMKPSKDRTITIQGREVGFEVVANILEFGSAKRNIRPQPFMRPARQQARAAAINAVAAEARKQLKKMGAT